MKLELTETELLYVLLMLDIDEYEKHAMINRFKGSVAVGVYTELERLPETAELIEKLEGVDSAKVFAKFLEAAKELKLIDIE